MTILWKKVCSLLLVSAAGLFVSAGTALSSTGSGSDLSIVQGGLFLVYETKTVPDRAVTFLGKTYALDPAPPHFFGLPEGSRVALLGVDFAQKPGVVSLKSVNMPWRIRVRIRSRPFQVSRLTVKSRFVSPPASLIARIVRERKEIISVLSRQTPIRFVQPFLLPVDGKVTHDFGAIRILNGKPMSRHSGEDIDAPEGTPVRAANDGTVVLSGRFYYDGKMVIIDHGGGLLTEYLHMSTILVHSGERIHRGDLVGRVGHTGRVTGPVFHYGAVLGGRHINPMLLTLFPGSRVLLEKPSGTVLP
ncbi:MAG: M23 family metallopeptidase [Leptospirales bacterium]